MDETLLKLAISHLSRSDKIMKNIISNTEQITFRKTPASYFHALVRTIINQQLSVKAAETIEKRLLQKQGGRTFSAEKLNNLSESTLNQCGLSRNKIKYVKTLSAAVVNKELNFKKLVMLDDETIGKQLMKYPGIGQWSIDIFLMSGLRRMDVFPIGDLIIRKSIQHHYLIPNDTHYDEYFAIAESWRPYRTIASYYLWKAFHQKQKIVESLKT